MPKIDESVINFAIYEGANEYFGMAEVTFPEINNLTTEVKGAGLNGTFNSPVMGHVDAMALGLNFRTLTKSGVKLLEPREHQIELRAAQQSTDSVTGRTIINRVKHVLRLRGQKLAPGKVAPASPADASGEYPITYWACWIDNEKMWEIDILNFKYEVGGVDYLAEVRKALGK